MKHQRSLAVIAAFAAIVLSACGGGSDTGEYDEAVMPSPPPPMARQAPSMDMVEDVESPAPAPVGEPGEEVAAQFIAYSHRVGVRLPMAQVETLQAVHTEACRAAGPAVCIITNSSYNNQSDDYASAMLSIRAKPAWIDGFLGGLEGEAEAADGEVTSRNTWAEDLTRAIIDTDARLSAQRTLQARLQGLLQTRDAELGDLLAIERELARVTGEIESLDSTLKAMRLRVSMSELTVDYETRVSPVAAQRFNPLGEAFGDFFFNLSSGLAGVITAFAVGLPWLILLGVMLFIWLRLIWPRIRRKQA